MHANDKHGLSCSCDSYDGRMPATLTDNWIKRQPCWTWLQTCLQILRLQGNINNYYNGTALSNYLLNQIKVLQSRHNTEISQCLQIAPTFRGPWLKKKMKQQCGSKSKLAKTLCSGILHWHNAVYLGNGFHGTGDVHAGCWLQHTKVTISITSHTESHCIVCSKTHRQKHI